MSKEKHDCTNCAGCRCETLAEYQEKASKTMGEHWKDFDRGLSYGVLGLAGETGEVCEIVKKHINGSRVLNRDDLKKELGDVMWYLAALSSHLGFTLTDIAETNIKKLRKRHGEKFSGYGDRSGEGK